MNGRVAIAAAEVLADVGLSHLSGFPSAIKMLEALPGKSRFGLIAEYQVSFTQGSVPAEIPGLANLEVPDQVYRYVRPKGNRDERIEQLPGLFEMGIESRQIEKSEFRKLSEERQIQFEMAHKSREVRFLPLEVGKRHYSRRSVRTEEHGEFIDEVANGWLRSSLSVIDL